MSELFEGWGFPGGSRKAHYFMEMTSLCRRWGFYRGPLEPEMGKVSPDDCVKCRREVDRRTIASMNEAAIRNSGEMP